MAIETERTLAHYRLTEKIGEGGMGVVWRAFDQKLRREVALKVLPDSFAEDPRRLARFEREARMIAALNHPNVVTVHSVEEADGTHFITMELISGKTLAELLPANGFPLTRFFELAIPMVGAVSAAHAQGIDHGDLKPRNVMVTDGGHVKVLDFGLARSRPQTPVTVSSQDVTVSTSGDSRISGTVPYMSPEQVQGEGHDPRSDIFSLGVMLYEMLTGRRPFSGKTAAQLVASVLRDRPRAPSSLNREVPRHLDRVIDLCLAKDPEERLPAALDLYDELQALKRSVGPARADVDPSVAVLPFVDMSVDRNQDYFCEGIADEIINALTHVEGLRVASRTSSFRFKDTTLDCREIGDRLGVAHLLEGSVRKAGERLRISAQLINCADGCQLWGERFDRELKDVFAIQEEIAGSIVAALAVKLSPQERRAIRQVATADVKAYDYYLRGRQLFRQFRRKSIEHARRMFARAIEVDPSFAGAYCGLADCHAYLYMFWDVKDEHIRGAEEASRKAVELDPELPEAYVSRGVAISLRDYDAADEQFAKALRLNATNFEAYYFQGRGYYARGKLEEAVRCFKNAIDARPEDYQSPTLLGSALRGLGREAESNEAFRLTLENGKKHLEVYPGEARALYFGANAMAQLGDDEEQAMKWAERALAVDPDEPQVLYNVACVYALLGHADRAIDCLARTIEHGGWWKTWMSNDPDLAVVSDHPRFRKLVE